MEKAQLKNYLQNKFNTDNWIQILRFLVDDRKYLTIHLAPKDRTNELTDQRSKEIFRHIKEIGVLKTSDGADLPIFDVELSTGGGKVNIEYNKVGVNSLLKRVMSNNAYKGLIVTFHYPATGQDEWRFSFISKSSASDFFAEIEAKETNPKKYTYIFGTSEEHRTAIDRLYTLKQSRFRVDDFFDAFNVEPISKGFFNEYKNFYLDFASIAEEDYFHIFQQSRKQRNDETDKEYKENVKRDARNFVKRLLSRIVFLYFLQKKKWIAASNTKYEDGDTNFLENLFNGYYGSIDKNEFYNAHLTKLFFEALNKPNRKGNFYTLPDGSEKCIPFLNGGLFEEGQEPKGHRDIVFPTYLFEELFRFFNSYNFTIYENSPQDHTIAVDPEMLGHIFENLLEDNKDKGAFYTPKEIVQYMTQESLIQYLYTSLPKVDKLKIEKLVREHNIEVFENENETIKLIDKAIDEVKICDPAIGSGAFPMGLLQEIFSIKALIHYQLGFEVWSPATVKQNIIQKSIYGVDIEIGAVDIARLRFWLSLVVDEDLPKPLPNLDYKIMQGDSLLESFKGIDLSKVATGNNLTIAEAKRDLFGNIEESQLKMTFSKTGLAEKIQSKTKKYFTADNTQKPILKKEIDNLVFEFIDYNIELREQQLQRLIIELENGKQQGKFSTKQQKAFEDYNEQLEQLSKYKDELYLLQQSSERPYFLWHLFFSDVFEKGGFDIVIGNPPYVDVKSLNNSYVKLLFEIFTTTENRINLYSIFLEQGWSLLNNKGTLCYINPNSLLINSSYTKIRSLLIDNLVKLIKLPDNVFVKAIVETMIILTCKSKKCDNVLGAYYKNDEVIDFNNLNFTEFKIDQWKEDKKVRFSIFTSSQLYNIINLIDQNINILPLKNDFDFCLGITPYDKAKGHTEELIKERKYHSKVKEDTTFVPLISGANITKYYVSDKIEEYLSYGEWLGAPRKSIFFTSPRVIVRQIISGNPPSIYAGYTDKELYHTQIGFSIIQKEKGKFNLKYLCAVLNSSLISFYHKYKFTDPEKNTFQKILIENCKEVPIIDLGQKDNCYNSFIHLVDYILYLKESKEKINDYTTNDALVLMFEETIDAMVYELYFEEHLKDLSLDVIDLVRQSLAGVADLPINDQINHLFKEWNEYENDLRNRIILQRTRSEYVSTIEKALDK